MNKDILICGVGGQGTVLAGKILSAAAADEGNPVRSAETIGMAQRGGSVTGHVRIGDRAHSALIPTGGADIMLAFEPYEAVRNLKYLKPDAPAIVCLKAVRPASQPMFSGDGSEAIEYLKHRCRLVTVDVEQGQEKFFNIYMLGVAAGSDALGIEPQTLLNRIEKSVPERFRNADRQAFLKGLELSKGII